MPIGGKDAFLSKVIFRRESNWYSKTKQMLKDMETIEEYWKEIQGFPNNYISSYGRVKSNGVIRKLQLSNAGYLRVLLTNGSRKWNASVHRLVALAFIPNPKCLPMVNHKDEDKQNNNVTNLEWCTREYNMNYGTAKRRFIETHNKRGSKKAERPVSMIKQNGEIAGTYRSAREAERQTGIHESSIRQVLYGKRKQAGGYGWKYAN